MREIALPMRECRILGSNPGASRTIREVSHVCQPVILGADFSIPPSHSWWILIFYPILRLMIDSYVTCIISTSSCWPRRYQIFPSILEHPPGYLWSQVVELSENVSRTRTYDRFLYHMLYKYLFMLTQEVSNIPINLRTPSRISLITGGGALRERISDKDSVLMLPTADLAACTRGSTSASSLSMALFLLSSSLFSSAACCFNTSISFFCSLAFYK